MSPGSQSIELQITSELENISLVSLCARTLCSYWSADAQTASAIELAVSEAVTNCIKHAYKGQPGKPVTVNLSLTDAAIIIDITDSGIAPPAGLFEHAGREFTEPSIELLTDHGRGLNLILSLMDDISLHSSNGSNRLRMQKFI